MNRELGASVAFIIICYNKCMQLPYKTGFSFGITSGIITALGIMMGLFSGTHLSYVVAGGILTVAIADAFSDAMAMHMSQEAQLKYSAKEMWQATISTFVAKFVFAAIFMLPVMLFNLNTAIVVNTAGGFILLAVVSFIIAEGESKKPWRLVVEHLFIAIIILFATYFAGVWIDFIFNR